MVFYGNTVTRVLIALYFLVIFVFDKHRGDGIGYRGSWIGDFFYSFIRENYLWKICCSYYPIVCYKTVELEGERAINHEEEETARVMLVTFLPCWD